uniref:G_PROTEIN_RECEP_F1_2 domain-containing protein n=1 Tax=Heterorhabditis bacteriophora TaxID=37862 RepID=A0A1I7WUG9_HETBA
MFCGALKCQSTLPINFVLLEELEDIHYEDQFITIVAIAVITAALLGILANIVVLVLSFGHVKGEFRLDISNFGLLLNIVDSKQNFMLFIVVPIRHRFFRHFVANLALVDIVCGAVFAFMGFINVNDNEKRFSISLMTYSSFAFCGSFGIMICALVPISISRILALSKPGIYSMLFSGHRSLFFCFLFDVLPISVLYVICVVDHDLARWLFYLYAVITVVSYLIAFTSNYMVFRIVARHICVVQNLRDQARLLETRQIAVATLAQAFVPLVCQYRKETVSCFSSIGKKAWSGRNKSIALYSEEREAFETKL